MAHVFDISQYSPPIAHILETPRLAVLGPGSPNISVRADLDVLTPETAFSPLGDRAMALACISGLWLYHDFLDEAHAISQELTTSEGSYWHAILHRREPDSANGKYWFRKVGAHPIFESLRQGSSEIGYNFTSLFAFVDFCERVRDSGTPDEEIAKRVQLLEWQLLFDWCYRLAIS